MNYNKLKEEIKLKKFTIEGIASKIGMTRTGLQLAFKEDTLKVVTLEKISELLNLPVYYWFVDEDNFSDTSTRRVFEVLEKIVVREMNKI
jgi:transcriptional regulator with XRE-family HTH domain